MEKDNMRQIIIYGAGKIGKQNYEFLKKYSLSKYVCAFCDKNYEDINAIDEIPVVSYENAKALGKTFVISLKRDKEVLVKEFEVDQVPYYSDLAEWIYDWFTGREREYLTYLYRNWNVTDGTFELFGNIEEEFFHKLESNLMGVKRLHGGYCTCCENDTLFVAQHDWLRDYYRCIYCNSIPRQRALMSVINEIKPDWRNKNIHECSPDGPTMKLMQKECQEYTYSYFFESLPLGHRLDDKSTNQNIECMTFADESFDIYITQDVFEHINNPYSALKEIERVLKPGGIHIFTVPLYPFMKSRSRICVKNGKVENILPAVYHGNPISKEGSLVTFDWGSDIAEIIEAESGMKTEIYDFKHTSENVKKGLEADFLQVLVSYKEDK